MKSHQQHLEEYRRLREETTDLNSHLLDMLSRKMLKQTRRKLGLDRIAIDEDAVGTAHTVMADYAVHFARKGGRRLQEVYFDEHPPAPGSVLGRYRRSLDTYCYTIFEVEETEGGVGVEAYDLLQRRSFFLMDRGFSQTAAPGMRFASGVLRLPDYALTTGASLPLSPSVIDRLAEEIPARIGHPEDVDFAALPPRDMGKLAALVIRHALRDGAASHVGYR